MYNNSYNNALQYSNYPMNNMVSPMNMNYMNRNDERFGGFVVPFLLGGLAGGAAVGVSRPRPVYVNPGPTPYPYYPGPYYGPRPY